MVKGGKERETPEARSEVEARKLFFLPLVSFSVLPLALPVSPSTSPLTGDNLINLAPHQLRSG